MSRKQVIHTDGACTNNGRAGAQAGYGVYWGDGDHRNVSGKLSGPQTNQRAEAQAVLTALKQTAGSHDAVEIRTDSKYVERAYKDSRPDPTEITYVPGHAGVYGNEQADVLARRGAASSGYSNGSTYGNNGYNNNSNNNYHNNGRDGYYYD